LNEGPYKDERKVLIKNIAWGATETEVRKIMEQAGRVVNISSPEDERGRQKGYKIVEYATKDMATKAKKTLNNKELKGRAIHITELRNKPGLNDLE
jgi:RNA recognition motif-containing protein